MKQNATKSWPSNLKTALQQDAKKTGFLGFLVLLLVVISLRAFMGSGRPSMATGARVTGGFGGTVSVPIPAMVFKPGAAAASFRGWLSNPIPPLTRNDFAVKSEYFAMDATKNSAPAPQSPFWAALEKSLSVQADQKEKHTAALVKLKQEAAALRLTSTIMDASPRAMVNGVLVGEGDMVQSFLVLKIEARGIIVEREGVQLAIPMK